MTGEQLLLIAREFCARHRVTVTDFAALVAAASASTARIEGIAVHADAQAQAESLRRVLEAVPALSGRNREFAQLCAQVHVTLAARG